MKKMIFLVLLLSVNVFAAKEVGNGGDVVVCKSPTGQLSYELLDYYEARVMRGIEIDLNPYLAADEKTLVLSVIDRLFDLNPSRYRFYKKVFEEFYGSQQMISGVALVDIPDSQHVFLPTDCHIHQAIIQREPKYPEDKRFIIDGDLWSKLDVVTRTGLVLHELIYRETLLAGHEDSVAARYFHSYLAAGKLQGLDVNEYYSFLKMVGFPDFDYEGLNLLICRPSMVNGERKICGQESQVLFNSFDLDQKPRLVQAHIVPPWAPWAKPTEYADNIQSVQVDRKRLLVFGEVRFYTSEALKWKIEWIHKYSSIGYNEPEDQFPDLQGLSIYSNKTCTEFYLCQDEGLGSPEYAIHFSRSGKIVGYMPYRYPVVYQVGDQYIKCAAGHHVRTTENDQLISCYLQNTLQFTGPFYDVFAKGQIFFRDGLVLNMESAESGFLFFNDEHGFDVQIPVSSFVGPDSLTYVYFASSDDWIGHIWGHMMTFGPGIGAWKMDTGQIHSLRFKEAQEISIPLFANQKVLTKGFSLREGGELIDWIEFESDLALMSDTGVRTKYRAPGIVYLGEDGYVFRCKAVKAGQETEEACPSTASASGGN